MRAVLEHDKVDFTESELFILSEALESYWFDCAQGEDEDLEAKKPAIEALSAKIEHVLRAYLPT